jgi:hypothetical protein
MAPRRCNPSSFAAIGALPVARTALGARLPKASIERPGASKALQKSFQRLPKISFSFPESRIINGLLANGGKKIAGRAVGPERGAARRPGQGPDARACVSRFANPGDCVSPCTACLRPSRFPPSAAGLRAGPAPASRTYSERCSSVKTDLFFWLPSWGGSAIGAFSAPSPPQGAASVGGSRARWSISSFRSGQARRALAKNAQRETGFAWAGDARNPPVSFTVGRPSAAHGEPVRDEIRPGRGREESAGRRRRQPTQDAEVVWCYGRWLLPPCSLAAGAPQRTRAFISATQASPSTTPVGRRQSSANRVCGRRRRPQTQPPLFGGSRRQAFDGNRDRLGLAPEAPPRHPDVTEQSDPRVWIAEVRRKLAIRLQRLPIGLAPGFERPMELIGLLGSDRQCGAPAQRVDRHPP